MLHYFLNYIIFRPILFQRSLSKNLSGMLNPKLIRTMKPLRIISIEDLDDRYAINLCRGDMILYCLMKIYDEKFQWRGRPKIDTHNEEAIERLKSAPRPVVRKFDLVIINSSVMFLFDKIYDEKFRWRKTPRIDDRNDEYVQHKEREKLLLREKPRIQVGFWSKLDVTWMELD